ncbi:hypothetical protein [Micromonospora echinofusca]|uniref:Uncharacterized protein n=1 Tax=Micromonospora echinofusca TaxID=47858 RepID=A0ABS3VXZ7_MICEH|nr:hypothetical protein [Micromonospora echinofusca]MBO4209402.1 hypothetical protein [Micromonospora echinofusca]
MTREPATTPATPPDGPAGEPARTYAPAAATLAFLALGWFAAMLWSARAEIQAAEVGAIAITLAANALPVVVAAALVTGAAVALVVANLLTRRGMLRPTPRFTATTATGLVVGVLGALVVTLTFSAGSASMVLAGTTAAAATVGGAVAGTRLTAAVGALVSAALAVFAVVLVLSLFNGQLLSLFGAGETQVSQFNAARWVSRLASLTAGLVAGLVAFGYLRRAHRRGAAPDLRWPAYLLAGAGPGLVLLVTEVIIRIGGGSVLNLAGALSEADGIAQRVLSGSRIDHAIGVLFVGALTTLIAFGRTLGPRPEDDDPADDDEDPALAAEPAADVPH